ncbi:glycosyltransferase 87 family protein [Paenibacillus sp. P25]|nr:glycosyltransferase 87 family protein [Paenibacillus sp. P25]
MLAAGSLIRVAAAPWIPGHPFDINLFKSWAASAAKSLSGFYLNGSSDYPPSYIYVLYIVGKLSSLPALSSYSTPLIKLPSILADGVTAYLLYRFAAKYVSFEMSLFVAAFYLLNPAVLVNSTFWGQVDSFFTMIVAAAVLLLANGRIGLSSVLFTAAVLMKPQGIIYLPVLFFELVRRRSFKSFVQAGIAALVTAAVVIAPFSLGQSPLWIVQLYAKTLGEYPYASVNAFNFFSLLGANYKADSSALLFFSYHTWGMIFIVLITLFSWWIYIKGGSDRFASAAALLLIAGVFTFSSGMHERYLFPAAALSLMAFINLKDQRLLWLSAGFSAAIFMNTYFILYGATNGGASYSFPLFLTSLLNVVFFIYLAKVIWDIAIRGKTKPIEPEPKPAADSFSANFQLPFKRRSG